MNDQDNPYTSDFDNPVYVAHRLLRLFVFSMFFIVFWKKLFSKKTKKDREINDFMQH